MNTTKAKRPKLEWEIKAILHPDLESEELPLVQAWMAVIDNKKNISKAVLWLSQNFPLPQSFLFLKRVQPFKDANKAHIIVAVDQRPLNYNPPPSSDNDGHEKSCTTSIFGLSRELISIEIPSRAPLTRQEFSKARDFWPCHFHEDKRLESVLNRTLKDIWGDRCMEIHCQNMVETLDLKFRSKAKVAAIAFDPITTRRVAMAFDISCGREENNKTGLVRHAAMNLIDSVAHSHGGGAWPLVSQEQQQPDENKKVQQLSSCLEYGSLIALPSLKNFSPKKVLFCF